MDKKFLVKAIIFNVAWVLWIMLSVLFGYLIAARFFPDNLAAFIPFSLAFIVVGIVPAFFAYRALFKTSKHMGKKGGGKNADCKANLQGVNEPAFDSNETGENDNN